MTIKTEIIDGFGTGTRAKVDDEGQLHVIVHPHPPKGEQITAIPFRQYFTDDGTNVGSNDMKVDGSTTNVDFYITASTSKDIYIKTLSFVIADASAVLNKFGNITALTNGVKFEWVTNDQGIVEIHEGLKSNFDFIRICGGNPGIGTGTNSFRASNVEGNSEGYIPTMNMSITFGLPYGVRLRKGTKDSLRFTIRDNVTGVDAFNVVGYGIQI